MKKWVRYPTGLTCLLFLVGYVWHQWFLGLSSALLLLLLLVIHLAVFARRIRGLGRAEIGMVAGIWAIFISLGFNLQSLHRGFFALRKPGLEKALLASSLTAKSTTGISPPEDELPRFQRVEVLLRSFGISQPDPSTTEFLFMGGLATKHYAYLHTRDPVINSTRSPSRWQRIWRMDEDWYLVSD